MEFTGINMKFLMDSKSEGRRNIGRPKNRWMIEHYKMSEIWKGDVARNRDV